MTRHPERCIEVDWGQESKAAYSVDVQIDAYDRAGLLRDITTVFANEQANVLKANMTTDADATMARLALTLEIADLGQLSRLLDKVLRLPNVTAAQRKR